MSSPGGETEGTLGHARSSTGPSGADAGATLNGGADARHEPASARRAGRPRRTNGEWLRPLRGTGRPDREEAVEELSSYLRAGLTKAFAGDSNVQSADLDDFTQEAIVRILGSLDSFRGDSKFTTWALAVGFRVAYTVLRKRRSADVSLDDLARFEVTTDTSGAPPRSEPPDRRTERDELLAALQRAIQERLTVRQRTAILAELQGVSSERLVELLGTNRNALYKLYHDARRNLRRALDDYGFSEDDILREVAQGDR